MPTILVVDDSLTFRSSLADRLKLDGFEVALASSGEHALRQLARHAPAAVILDLLMLGMGGLEACRQIRASANDLPILMLTASDDLRARIDSRAAGASEFLLKEPDFEAVVARVLDFVRRMTAERLQDGPSAGGVMPATRVGSEGKGKTLFDQVIVASGLAPIIAEPSVVRACRRAGIDAYLMTASDLERALPNIERALRMFLPAGELETKLDAISALVNRPTNRRGADSGA